MVKDKNTSLGKLVIPRHWRPSASLACTYRLRVVAGAVIHQPRDTHISVQVITRCQNGTRYAENSFLVRSAEQTTVLARRHTRPAPECAGEIGGIFVAEFTGNIGNANGVVLQ